MSVAAAGGGETVAVAQGGPMDGRVLGSADAQEYDVAMADGSRWTYRRTPETAVLDDGTRAAVFACAGRA